MFVGDSLTVRTRSNGFLVWHVRPLCTSENGSGDTDIQYQFLPSESEGEVAVLVVINS